MEPNQKAPVVVNLGKSTRKRIKRLKRGEGKLMNEVHDELARLKASGEVSATAEPIVFIVERRPESAMPWMPMQKLFSM